MSLQRILIESQPFNAARPGLWFHRGLWPAKWIQHPHLGEIPYLIAYKLPFHLEEETSVRLHVTADERYELFLDGELVGRGPERGDGENWFFESYEGSIAAGDHVFVARVLSLGDKAAFAQMSIRHGFLLCPEEEALQPLLATGQAHWLAKKVEGIEWQSPTCAWGTGWNEVIHGEQYNWGHERGEGDDWLAVKAGVHGARVHSQQEVISHHRLRPAMLPPMLDAPIPKGPKVKYVSEFASRPVAAVPIHATDSSEDGVKNFQMLVDDHAVVEVGPNSKYRVLVDLGNYYCARPELTVSDGRGARVDIVWAEGLYEDIDHWSKGNRDEIEGKHFTATFHQAADGPGDTFYASGHHEPQKFRPIWWQAGRYVEILVETGHRPLKLQSLRFRETRYPLEMEGQFRASDPAVNEIIPIMVRGMQMCSHETYMDCPFYEQLMYVGDTRLEVLTTYVMTADERLPRKALRLFDWSRLQSGMTQSRYPSWARQIIPPFSLWWVAMCHDYGLWRGEPEFAKSLLPGVRSVCDHFAGLINEDGLMRAPDGWNFTDWVSTATNPENKEDRHYKWPAGVPADGDWEISGILNWHAALVFRLAGELESWFGEPEIAALQQRRAQGLAAATDKHFWNEDKGLYADNLAHNQWSEHAQCLALLSGFVPEARAGRVGEGLLADPDLARTTIYFNYYYFETMRLLGRMDAFFERLKVWDELVKMGLKTTIEQPEPTRSDCHAWGAHPLFHFYATLAGIRPAGPGFAAVEVKPQLGHLESVQGVLPHPAGEITFDISSVRTGVQLPDGVTLA